MTPSSRVVDAVRRIEHIQLDALCHRAQIVVEETMFANAGGAPGGFGGFGTPGAPTTPFGGVAAGGENKVGLARARMGLLRALTSAPSYS